jgi:hypothetical protein
MTAHPFGPNGCALVRCWGVEVVDPKLSKRVSQGRGTGKATGGSVCIRLCYTRQVVTRD